MSTVKEVEIYNKLQKIQLELKAPKSQYNAYGKYNYRNLEDIMEALKPLFKKHKVAMIVQDTIIEIAGRVYVEANVELFDIENIDGPTIKTKGYAREPLQKTGMDEAQVTGSASSYSRKYTLNGLFCIDDTKDGDALPQDTPATKLATVKSKGPEKIKTKKQVVALEDLAKETDTDLVKLYAHYNAKNGYDMTVANYNNAITTLNKKKKTETKESVKNV